ncbi:ATP-dependent DNA helicase [Trichonephila clavipes]|nr:ATP-dependent DNA helicase [Trichonephila clavipes]
MFFVCRFNHGIVERNYAGVRYILFGITKAGLNGVVGPDFVLMDENTRLHRSIVVSETLKIENIPGTQRLENLRVHATETRSSESSDQREVRLETNRIRTNQIRSSERTELRERRLQNVRISTARSRRTLHADLNLSAFHYDSNNEYSLHSNVVIGKMDKICMYCSALKFKNETRGMCCASGKVKLPDLHSPPEPLSTFLSAVTRVSKHFLENIRKYNSCFQMTSFGATNIVRENYMPTSSVHSSSEQYRMLLSKIAVDQYTWTISFQDLRTVNGQLCATYRQACQELNLLENDAHWDTALADASNTARPQQIRTLFAIIFTTCFPSNPKDLWEKYKDYMSEDILHRLRAANQNPDIQFTPNVYNEALIFIEDIFLTIANKALVQLGMPASNRPANNLFDRDLQRETHYDSDELGTFVRTNLPHLILEQRIAYDRIMRAITEQSGGLFFIDAPGGTGKTFLLSLILATIRSQNNIALVIASSGIAATLLDGGRTTHSALKLPLNLQNTEAPTCNISKNSGMGKVLQTCQIIIWDECTMSHKKTLEALDRTLRGFRGNRRIFGGALILLSGDFRQTLPIIPRSTPAEELHACLKSSVLWRHLQKLTLKTNMRVQLQRDASAGNFTKQLMDIGNGRMEIDESTQCITLPANFCKITESIDELVQKVFPNIAQNYKNHPWLSMRAILAAKNIDVNTINFTIQHGIPSETTTYKSIDTVENQDEVATIQLNS